MAILYYLFYILIYFVIPAFVLLFLIKLFSKRVENAVANLQESKLSWKFKLVEWSKKLFPALRITFFTFITAIVALSVCATLIYPFAKKYHNEERTHQLIHILQSTSRENPTQLINEKEWMRNHPNMGDLFTDEFGNRLEINAKLKTITSYGADGIPKTPDDIVTKW